MLGLLDNKQGGWLVAAINFEAIRFAQLALAGAGQLCSMHAFACRNRTKFRRIAFCNDTCPDITLAEMSELARGRHLLRCILIVAAMIATEETRAQMSAALARPLAESRGIAGDNTVVSASIASQGHIIIQSSARKQVTMNGKTVPLGGKLGDATVIGISDSQLTLRIAGQRKRLNIYGNVVKRIKNDELTPAPTTTELGAGK